MRLNRSKSNENIFLIDLSTYLLKRKIGANKAKITIF